MAAKKKTRKREPALRAGLPDRPAPKNKSKQARDAEKRAGGGRLSNRQQRIRKKMEDSPGSGEQSGRGRENPKTGSRRGASGTGPGVSRASAARRDTRDHGIKQRERRIKEIKRRRKK